MTTPSPYPLGVDPVHVQIIAASAAAGGRNDGSVLLLARPETIRVYLPNRSATKTVRDALQRVGYEVTTAAGNIRNRGLVVSGWSAQGLESRLDAMRGVLHRLAASPDAMATLALGQLSRTPTGELPGRTGQQHLIDQLSTGLRSWISATSGIHALSDPRARPADPGCALRLSAARRAEEAIDDLAARQARVAEFALALYPSLRETMTHDAARDCALRWAGTAFHLTPRLGQDLSPLFRGAARRSGPASSLDASQPGSAPKTLPLTGKSRSPRSPGEFPTIGAWPPSRPPSTRGMTHPSGRKSPGRGTSRRR
jgi:hypothetical protein